MTHNGVPLNRALSKLGILSRAEAGRAIAAGRVRVNGRIVTDPSCSVVPERIKIVVDGRPALRPQWRTIMFHKPKGVLTTRRDPRGRRTIYDVLGEAGKGLIAVGRLDLATSGLLLLTNDTRLGDWITDPANAIPRVYVVTVRGRVGAADAERLLAGIQSDGDCLHAAAVSITKASGRESTLIVELREGKNREVRRLFEAIGHEVTGLKRVKLGSLELGVLPAGAWRELSRSEIRDAFGRTSSS
jgi:23S rRNA pseudouridine2605 synthase